MESNPFSTEFVDSFAADIPYPDRLILHGAVFNSLKAILDAMREREAALRRGGAAGVSAPGQLLVLLAPAAGYGKTRFLAHAGRALSEEFEMVPLHFQKGSPIRWVSVFNDLVEHCFERVAPAGELRLIDELARRVFADLTAHLIRSGVVPAPDPQEAVRALTDTPLEVFDFSNAEGRVVQWFCSVFEALLPLLAAEAERRYSLTREASVFWLRALYVQSREVVEKGGAGAGREGFVTGLEGDGGETAVDRLAGLGRLLCRWRPVIFIADQLNSFLGDRERGAELGGILVDLPEIVPGSVTIVSVNRDLWEATFRGSLPGAVEDRLISEALLLGGMSPEEARRFVEQRLVEAGIPDDVASRFLPWMESGSENGFSGSGELSPRRLLRIAKERWDAFVASGGDAPVAQEAKRDESPASSSQGTGFKPLEPLVFDEHLTLRPRRFKVPRREDLEDAAKIEEIQGAGGGVSGKKVPALAETVENLKAEAQRAFFEFHEIFKAVLSPEGGDASATAIEGEIRSEVEAAMETDAAGGGIVEAPRETAAGDEEKEGLAQEYHRLRRDVLAGPAPEHLDLVRFYAVLNGVGELLPVVVQNEFDLPEYRGFRVLEWSNESQLVFFGLLSLKSSRYWDALIRYASRFIESETRGDSSARARVVKVVVLAPEGDAVEASLWRSDLANLGGQVPSIDVVEVDRETVAAIYAIERLLGEARDRGNTCKSEEVSRFAIRELDFFWRRLTRGAVS